MNTEVLVLNQDYEPLNVCAMPRAFRLVIGGKAEILAEGRPIRSASRSWTAPSVVRCSADWGGSRGRVWRWKRARLRPPVRRRRP